MNNPLPSNQTLIEYSADLPWGEVERQKRAFNQAVSRLSGKGHDDNLPLDAFAEAVGAPVSSYFDLDDVNGANIVLANSRQRQLILGAYVSTRYRSGKSLLHSMTPYNLNPSVNHTNIHETDDPNEKMRAMGAEIELGLVHHNGSSPTDEEMLNYIRIYSQEAQKRGIYPRLDGEACQYQVEAHIAPSVGYHKTRFALEGIMATLAIASEMTGLRTAVMSTYPTLSDFKMNEEPKVRTAVDLMLEVNGYFPDYVQRLEAAKARYHVTTPAHYVQMFRNQGCHIHLDLAGRSEALGLLTFYTMLRSASAVANAAVLKGGPFVNGTCDPELLCAREYLRNVTVTGRYLDIPLAPHYSQIDMKNYADLLRSERVNAMARALLFNGETPDQPISAMHNPIGRVRPDLSTNKRVCTVESTGMPANISVSRMAAVLTDFEYSHSIIEHYFRKYGCDLGPMYEDRTLWAILGPLERVSYIQQQDASDRNCTDVTVTTAAGTEMTLAEFYEMKRIYMHRTLSDVVAEVTPRDIDDVYTSLGRMLEPPSGHVAQTVAQFVSDPKLRSTGNWGRILRNAFIEAGGTPGQHNPDAVLNVVNQIHDAMKARYLQTV